MAEKVKTNYKYVLAMIYRSPASILVENNNNLPRISFNASVEQNAFSLLIDYKELITQSLCEITSFVVAADEW